MTTNKKLYAKRDLRGLGQHYINHVSAMTSEELFLKSDIAAELAWRDMEIDRLRAEKEAAEGQAAKRQEAKKTKYGVDECYCMWYECSKCKGTMITDSSKFCPDCGSKIVTTPQDGLQDSNKQHE